MPISVGESAPRLNFKLLDQKSGPAVEKSGSPERNVSYRPIPCPSKALIDCICAPQRIPILFRVQSSTGISTLSTIRSLEGGFAQIDVS